MKIVHLEGVLMNNNEFLFKGRTMFLTNEEVQEFIKDSLTDDEKRKIEEAFNLLIDKENDTETYSELLYKLRVFQRN
jgi:hypothetical protein